MTRTFLLPFLFVSLLGACAQQPGITRLSGAETRSVTDAPRVVPAGFTPVQGGTRMELVTADGAVFDGVLRAELQPVIVPLAGTTQPLVGGGTDLVGDVVAGEARLNCRFRLRNPVRGLDGGGTGRCTSGERTVVFLF
jgi:hypothetical protein